MIRAFLNRVRTVEARLIEVWSDAARAAAALARKNGYRRGSDVSTGGSGRAQMFAHPEGHTLQIGPQGAWMHNSPTAGNVASYGRGEDTVRSLSDRLSQVHGKTSEAFKQPVRAFLRKVRAVESRLIEVGWTDDARAASALARAAKAQGFKPVQRIDQGQVRTNIYEHPDTGERIRHTVGPRPQGIGGSYDDWRHEAPIEGKPKGNYRFVAQGKGADFEQHISQHEIKMPPQGTVPSGPQRVPGLVKQSEAFAHYEPRKSGGHMGAQDASGSVARISSAEQEGGPGSGRRPGGGVKYGHGANTPAAQKATAAGWKPTGSEHGTQYYSHPDKPGHILAVHNDGTANQYSPKEAEAAGVSGLAQVTRSGAKPIEARLVSTDEDEHDEDVPMDSFKSDLERKKSLRQVMGNPDDKEREDEGILDELMGDSDCPDSEKDADGNCPGDEDFDPDTAGQYMTADEDEQQSGDEPEDAGKKDKEDVNYRYSPDPVKTCGKCRFFQEPGACSKVSGLIRKIDVCDLFQPKTDAVQARMAEAKKPVQARLVSAEDEKAPPGGEDVVKALKKKSDVDEPYAVAWSMYDKGYI